MKFCAVWAFPPRRCRTRRPRTARSLFRFQRSRRFDEIMRSAGATSAPASMPAPAPRRTAETPPCGSPQRPVQSVPDAQPGCRPFDPSASGPARATCAKCAACPAGAAIPPPPRQHPGHHPHRHHHQDFLRKDGPGGCFNTTALNEGKADFQRFFADSVAVVPDERAVSTTPARKKR